MKKINRIIIIEFLTYGVGAKMLITNIIENESGLAGFGAMLIVLGYLVGKWRKEGLLTKFLKENNNPNQINNSKSPNDKTLLLLVTFLTCLALWSLKSKEIAELENNVSDVESLAYDNDSRIYDVESVVSEIETVVNDLY